MWTSSDIGPLISRLGLDPHLIFTGHVPDEDIPLLYNGADALAFPSLFEGFGFPILEAMACGCPVVTSNVTSLPEVAGGAAIIVNPYRVDDIAEGLYRALTDQPLRVDLISRGLARSREFTWRKTAADVLKIYRQVA
jgi:glycosyltransferase involved in cell wall biosynthesis